MFFIKFLIYIYVIPTILTFLFINIIRFLFKDAYQEIIIKKFPNKTKEEYDEINYKLLKLSFMPLLNIIITLTLIIALIFNPIFLILLATFFVFLYQYLKNI